MMTASVERGDGPPRPTYDVRLSDGRTLTGRVQGCGGYVATDLRLAAHLNGQLHEEHHKPPFMQKGEEGLVAIGVNDHDGVPAGARFEKVKASTIAHVSRDGRIVWP